MNRHHPAFALLVCGLIVATVARAATPQLTAATPLTVELSDDRPVEIVYTHDDNRLVSLRAVTDAANVDIRLEGSAEKAYGAYHVRGDFDWTFRSESAASQLCDRLPQFPATWKLVFTLREGGTCTLKLSVEDQGALPKLRWSEEGGRLTVRRLGQTKLTAKAEPGFHPNHPTLPSNVASPTIAANGDAQFLLPAGLWQLVARGGNGVGTLRSVLIPVSSGAETVVEWPQMRTLEGEKNRGLNELSLRDADGDKETGHVLLAAPMFPETPKPGAVRVLEGGQPGKVLQVESVPAKLHVVVLFDSSFSMRKIFGEAQAAALRFIETLPPDCTVDFFDFDTKVKEIPATDRAALLAAVRGIQADGSTKLYDAVLRGLGKCAGHRRSAIVVFTDGFDAQVDDPGRGSRASQDEVFAAVAKSRVPLFTIAYGEKPDEQTLQRLATESGGAYYRAQADSIATVFDQIRGIVDRDYRITYRRPAKVAPSNTPVITVVLDVSGSMNMAPSTEGCDFRIEKAKDLLRGFFGRLPAGSVVQIFTFASSVDLIQVPTSDTARLRHSLLDVEADGSTETLDAARAALASLDAIPTRNRYLLFITDAALQLDGEAQRKEFATVLATMKERAIRCIWVGMVAEKEQAPFVDAAQQTSGTYVVSPGTESLEKALSSLQQTLAEKAAGNDIALEVLIDKPDASGKPHLYGGNGLFPLPVTGFTAENSVGSLTATIVDGTSTPPAEVAPESSTPDTIAESDTDSGPTAKTGAPANTGPAATSGKANSRPATQPTAKQAPRADLPDLSAEGVDIPTPESAADAISKIGE
jgi:Mg-chelatase subunit ChlD